MLALLTKKIGHDMQELSEKLKGMDKILSL